MNKKPFPGDRTQAAPKRISQGCFTTRSSLASVAWLLAGAMMLAGCANLNTQLLPFAPRNSDTEAKLAYARLMEKHGQSVQAEQLYQVMIKQDQRQQVAYQRLGVLAAKRGQYTEANDYLQRALKAAPPTAELYNDIGYNYYLEDKLEEAEASYRKAIERNPQYAAAHNNLGLALGQQRRYEESLAEFRLGGPEAQAYTNLAYLYAQNREISRAKQSFTRALDLDPTLKPAAEGLIQLATLSGDIPNPNEPAAKKSRMVASNDKPSKAPTMHKVSQKRPAEKPKDDTADVAAANKKAALDKSEAKPSILPQGVEPYSWKQPDQTASTTKPAPSKSTKKQPSGDELVQQWKDQKNAPARADGKSASPRSIEVSVEDRPVRRSSRAANKSSPGEARAPSAAQMAAVRQMPATQTKSTTEVVKIERAPQAPRELPTASPGSKPAHTPANTIAQQRSIPQPATAAHSVRVDRCVNRWTAPPTSQSARIEETLSSSRTATVNAKPVARRTALADDSNCSGGPTAQQPAPPAPAEPPSPSDGTSRRNPMRDKTASSGMRRKVSSPPEAPPEAPPEPKLTQQQPFTLHQPQSVDAALHSSRRPSNAPESVPEMQRIPQTQNSSEPVRRRPTPKMAEVRVKPENCPPLIPQPSSQVAPTAPSLPRVVGDVSTPPATGSEHAVPLSGIEVLRPNMEQLSTSAAATDSPDLQVQPQVITMPTTLIHRAGESLAAASASQPTAAQPEQSQPVQSQAVLAQPVQSQAVQSQPVQTQPALTPAAASSETADTKPFVDPISVAAQNSRAALPVLLPPGVMPPAIVGSQASPAVPQMPRMNAESSEPTTSSIVLAGGTQPQLQSTPIAAPSASQAVALNPSKPLSPQQLVNQAASALEQHDLEKALTDYERALEQSPSYLPALIGRAKVYRDLGQFDESLADSTRLIRTYPENIEGFLERGLTRAAMGLVPEAAEDFDMAVQIDAASVAARLERGKARLMLRDFAAALADYNEVLRLAPGMSRGYIERARAERLMGRSEDALDDYTAAIRLDGQGIDGLLERALLNMELNKPQSSLADLNAAIDRVPGDARIYVARARLYRHARAWHEAQDDLQAAERLDPLSKPLQMEREALQKVMPKNAQASAGS